jgi:hypothetical protein
VTAQVKPISDVLSMLGIEIYELTEQLGSIEATLQECIFEKKPVDAAAMTQLQSIDLVFQTLSALSGFTLTLATLVSPNVEVEISKALDQITLSELATRLRGDATSLRNGENAPAGPAGRAVTGHEEPFEDMLT